MTLALGLRMRGLLPLAVLVATGGCFATRTDVRLVQSDIAALRTELTRSNAEQRATLTKALAMLQVASDSLSRVSARTVSIQGDGRGEMRSIKEQLLQIQQLLGQNSATMARLQRELAERVSAPPATTVQPIGSLPPGAADSAAAAAARVPGALELYQSARDQLNRGSTATARILYQDFLTTYPQHEYAPAAQFGLATTFEREKNSAAAETAYAAVVSKYENAPEAPTALYKRAMLFLQQQNNAKALELFDQVVKRYPRSDEASFAADQIKKLR